MAIVSEQGVSFIIAVFDVSVGLLEKTINSIRKHAPANYEIILQVNDTAVGGVNDLMDCGNIVIYKEPDSGIYNALNKALVKCNFEWVMIFGAGDKLLTSDIFMQECDNESNVFFGNTQFRHLDGSVSYDKLSGQLNWNKGMFFCHQSCITRRNAILCLGGFNETYELSADYDLYLRIDPLSFRYHAGVVSEYDLNGESFHRVNESIRERVQIRHAVNSTNKLKLFKDECYWEIFLLLRRFKSLF